jgi:hypothetical protein
MPIIPEITEEQFEELFKAKLGGHYERALKIFKHYGTLLSWDVTNILFHAADQGKVDTVLTELEKHWEEHIQFQHPEIRGTVNDAGTGVNKTQQMFLHLCQDILQLKPT